jgi:hypothetical protein
MDFKNFVIIVAAGKGLRMEAATKNAAPQVMLR